MPSGTLPTYSYVPPLRPGVEAQLRTCSSRRARLFKGGTYFRSRDVGLQQNKISVQVIEHSETEAVCVVTNYNLVKEENVLGPATASILRLQMRPDQYVKIDQLDTIPRAQNYSISLKIAPEVLSVADLGRFTFSKLFSVPSLLSINLTPDDVIFTPASEIIIKPRYRVYALESLTVTDETTGAISTGWDIEKLRTAVNANDPWIEMLERSGPTDDGMGGPPIPVANPKDVQDTGTDAPVLTAFAETFLSGGDGLPDSPNNEATGPTRSLVHVNYGEAQNGELKEVNIVYEWVGDSAIDGSWKAY